MDRGDDEIERRKSLVVVVQRAIAQDIAFSAFEDTEPPLELLVERVDLRLLAAHRVGIKPTGIGGIFTVVAHAKVLFAQRYRRLGHLTNGYLAVAPVAMHVQDSTQI